MLVALLNLIDKPKQFRLIALNIFMPKVRIKYYIQRKFLFWWVQQEEWVEVIGNPDCIKNHMVLKKMEYDTIPQAENYISKKLKRYSTIKNRNIHAIYKK